VNNKAGIGVNLSTWIIATKSGSWCSRAPTKNNLKQKIAFLSNFRFNHFRGEIAFSEFFTKNAVLKELKARIFTAFARIIQLFN
jgi:hypothetical protein